jgi:hypothetical protein
VGQTGFGLASGLDLLHDVTIYDPIEADREETLNRENLPYGWNSKSFDESLKELRIRNIVWIDRISSAELSEAINLM